MPACREGHRELSLLSVPFWFNDRNCPHTMAVLPSIVASLRRLSPYWDAAANAPRPEAMAMMQQTEMPQSRA